jgi:hypothetical protein
LIDKKYRYYKMAQIWQRQNTIKAFEVNPNGKIYILTRQKDKIETNYYLKIYDIETDEVIYNIFVK